MKLTLQRLNVCAMAFAYDIGNYKEWLTDFSCELRGGVVYGTVSLPGDGAWTLSELLTGNVRFAGKGEVLLDGSAVTQAELRRLGHKVGEIPLPPRTFCTVQRLLRRGIAKSGYGCSAEELAERFGLPPEKAVWGRLESLAGEYGGWVCRRKTDFLLSAAAGVHGRAASDRGDAGRTAIPARTGVHGADSLLRGAAGDGADGRGAADKFPVDGADSVTCGERAANAGCVCGND